MAYWLFKSEPISYSFASLASEPDRTTSWEGVRNFQARNFLRDEMRVGDKVLFYHSNTETPGIAGIAEVVEAGSPDPTAFEPGSKYFDPKSRPEKPTWYQVKIRAVRAVEPLLPLSKLRESDELKGLELLRKGSRLSVQSVAPEHWRSVMRLAGIEEE